MKRNSKSDVRRRTFLKAGGVGAAAVLAGCNGLGGSGNTESGGSNGGNGADGANNGSGGGETDRRDLNQRGLNPAALGYLGPLSTDVGKAGYRSAQIAISEMNNEGGILQNAASLFEADTRNDPSHARAAVKRLIEQKNVGAIIGVFSSELMLNIADQMAKARMPFLVTGAASPKLSAAKTGKNYEKYKNVFRVSPVNSDFQARALAEYAKFLNDQHGWTKFAIVAENALWTKPIIDTLPAGLKDNGLEVTMTKRFSPDTSDFTPLLDRVKKSGADVLLKAIGHASAPKLLSTWHQQKYPFAQEGINVSSMSPHYWTDTDGGCLYETTGPSGVTAVTSKSKPFLKKYQEDSQERPSLPTYMGVGSYDAVHVYANAVESLGSYDPDRSDAVYHWLRRTSMKGAGGHIAFYGKDEKYPNDVKYGTNREPFVVEQWQKAKNGNGLAGTDGTKTTVWPKKYATGKHVVPSWL